MKVKSENVEEKYLAQYKEAAKGCWYVESYFKISHIERRQAKNATFVKDWANIIIPSGFLKNGK